MSCFGGKVGKDDQEKLGARCGKNPKRAPVTKHPKIAMGKGGLRKPGGGKRSA